jgi:hypothetical protein
VETGSREGTAIAPEPSPVALRQFVNRCSGPYAIQAHGADEERNEVVQEEVVRVRDDEAVRRRDQCPFSVSAYSNRRSRRRRALGRSGLPECPRT